MLPSGSRWSVGAYQFAVMLAVAGLGFVGAPWWMALIAAALLFGSTILEHAEIQSRAIGVNATAVAGTSVLTVAAVSLGFAGMCYVAGQALASLMLG